MLGLSYSLGWSISLTLNRQEGWKSASHSSSVELWTWLFTLEHESLKRVQSKLWDPTVFVLRMRQPWSMPKEVVLKNSKSWSSASNKIPSPKPSTNKAPASLPALITKSSLQRGKKRNLAEGEHHHLHYYPWPKHSTKKPRQCSSRVWLSYGFWQGMHITLSSPMIVNWITFQSWKGTWGDE